MQRHKKNKDANGGVPCRCAMDKDDYDLHAANAAAPKATAPKAPDAPQKEQEAQQKEQAADDSDDGMDDYDVDPAEVLRKHKEWADGKVQDAHAK